MADTRRASTDAFRAKRLIHKTEHLIYRKADKMKHTQRWACACALAVMTTGLLAGCGGGGGGSSSSTPIMGGGGSNPQTSTATIVGVLQDQATGTLLAGRTVTVQGTGLTGLTDNNGAFSIGSVPIASVTLAIIDASGTSDGTYSVDISKVSGSPRNLGTIKLAVSGGGMTPPGGPVIH